MKRSVSLVIAGMIGITVMAQPPGGGGFGGPPGGGFGGPPGGTERKLLKDFDKNSDGWLNAEERKVARLEAKKSGSGRRGGGFGGPPGMGRSKVEYKPGPAIAPGDVTNYPDQPLYDPNVVRTIFLTFENADWEKELEDFHGTDIDVPARMLVDGKTYTNVGVHFRGMSSYTGVGTGGKRSLNISMDLADSKQRLYSYKTLNLNNSHDDGTFLNTVLFSTIANHHLPAPKANMVKVVINGEYWGVYTNVQQFDKVFLQEHFNTTKGSRWKVRGSPGGRGGLEYFGDKIEEYKRIFEIKSNDDPKAWAALIHLCKMLHETPADKLPAALEPIMDVPSVLWFLALDVSLINNDGYWTRASDYCLYMDTHGKFHIVPHDMNESFRPAMGGPGMGGPGMGGMMPMMMGKPGEILPEFLRDSLRLDDDQKKQLAALQNDVDSKFAKILTEDQRKSLAAPPPMPFGAGPGGPPGRGGPNGGTRSVDLDPLVGLTDKSKPLRSKLLAVPKYKLQYLANVKMIAQTDLDWATLGPIVAKYKALLDKDIAADTRKLSGHEEFLALTADTPGPVRGREMPLRTFADDRRKSLLQNAEIKKLR